MIKEKGLDEKLKWYDKRIYFYPIKSWAYWALIVVIYLAVEFFVQKNPSSPICSIEKVTILGFFIIVMVPPLLDIALKLICEAIKEGLIGGISKLRSAVIEGLSTSDGSMERFFKLLMQKTVTFSLIPEAKDLPSEQYDTFKKCIDGKKYPEARSFAQKMINDNPNSEYPYLYLGIAYLNDVNIKTEERFNKAEESLLIAEKKNPANPVTVFYLVNLEDQKGNKDKALDLVINFLKNDVQDKIEKAHLLNYEAVLFWQKDKIDEAMLLVQEAHKLLDGHEVIFEEPKLFRKDTVYIKIHNTLGYLLVLRGKDKSETGEKMDDIDRAIKIAEYLKKLKKTHDLEDFSPLYGIVQDTIGYIYYKVYKKRRQKEFLLASIDYFTESLKITKSELVRAHLQEVFDELQKYTQ
ncbi:MAG: hypothetical protein WC412_09310 [Candidatus Omnitrophota bacterium]